MRRALLSSLSLLAVIPAVARAQTATTAAPAEQVFTLGELQITAHAPTGETIGGSVVSEETLRQFDKSTVDRALDLIPGVTASETGGSRNEALVFVRGFDRFQTTLSIDGVRVFLPADNRIDFARFLTADLSEVQVSKGYVSVMDGPGGLGGAINLVTRKPTQAFEAEARVGGAFDGDGTNNGYSASAVIGAKRDLFYVQLSGAKTDRDHFALSSDFKPTVLENGGARDHSDSDDWRVNFKAGLTPNDTDEYSLNYTRQEGAKNAPYHVTDTASTRYWSWPYWNIDSLYFLSKTKIGDALTIRSRLYTNSFDNLLSSFDDATQKTQTLPRAFQSYYADRATGGNLEADLDLGKSDVLKAVFYARQDKHRERQDGFVKSGALNVPYAEPWQTDLENTYSFAVENTASLTDSVTLIVGGSYDWRHLIEANDVTNSVSGTTVSFQQVNYPLKDGQALNGQATLAWRLSDETKLHASISSRTRFPTIFERFSARMGAAIPNPDVKAERATSYEVGGETQVGRAKLSGAAFYSDLTDALILIPVVVPTFGTVNQTKNAGDGRYYGFEASLTAPISEAVELGLNYTYLQRELTDPTNPAFRLTGTPNQKIFAYANIRLTPSLTVTPNVEIASDRWTVTSSSTITPPLYYRTGAYALLNLSAAWTINSKADLIVGAANLFDSNYSLVDGFPEQGRHFFASLRVKL